MANTEKGVEGRRDFLKLASLGTVLGGAAIAAGTSVQASETLDDTGSGYRENGSCQNLL